MDGREEEVSGKQEAVLNSLKKKIKKKKKKQYLFVIIFFILSVTSRVDEPGQKHTYARYLKRKWQYQQSMLITKRHEVVSNLRWNRNVFSERRAFETGSQRFLCISANDNVQGEAELKNNSSSHR